MAPVLLSLFLHRDIFRYELIGIHVWRQSQTQTVIYNFSQDDNNILHPQRFDLSSGDTGLYYEFPLYQWMVAQLDKAFGYSVSHSRCFSFFCFFIFLLGFYKLIRHFLSPWPALLVNAFLCFSPLLYYYCVNPLPDILALSCATGCLHFVYCFRETGSWKQLFQAGLCLLFAALAKLPYLLFGAVLFPVLWSNFRKQGLKPLLLQKLLLIAILLPAIGWYIFAIPYWEGNGITGGLLTNQTDPLILLQYLWFHLISSFPELISNYAAFPLVLLGMYYTLKEKGLRSLSLRPLLLVFVFLLLYLVFEINMIERSHDYYLLPFVPFVFLPLGKGIQRLREQRSAYLIYILLAIMPLTAYLRIQHRWDLQQPGFHADYLNEQVDLQRVIPEKAICVVDHDASKFIALYYLKRFGYSLPKDAIGESKLMELEKKGASVLVTENRTFKPEEYPHFSFSLLFDKGLRVYQFKSK